MDERLLLAVRCPENSAPRTGLAGIRAQFDDALEEEPNVRSAQYNLLIALLIDKAELQALYQRNDEHFVTVGYSIADLPSNVNVDYPNSLAIRNSIRDRMG